jgi:IS30 family transposase
LPGFFFLQKRGMNAINGVRKYRRLTYEDRKVIEQMGKNRYGVCEIAEVIGVHRDTIYKEYARCQMKRKTYSADIAQEKWNEQHKGNKVVESKL